MKINIIKLKLGIAIALLLISIKNNAQESSKQGNDTIGQIVKGLQSDFKPLKNLKINGFIQAQWQRADTIGSPSFAGGDFKGLDNRFNVRRARLKTVYAGDATQIVFQLDLKESGVFIKEAYGVYTEPFLKTFSLTGGMFNRPIGFEVEYSSAAFESPERTRITQTLFNDEVDLGAKLTIQAPKSSPLSFIKLDAGIFSGNGANSETDKYKDFIGHLSLKKNLLNESLLLTGGISYYNGGWANQSGVVYKMDSAKFIKDLSYKKGDKVKRQYYGFDGQLSINSSIGLTTLRGEYIWGQQPGTSKTSISPKGLVSETKDIVALDTSKTLYTVTTAAIGSDVYLRNFSGGYIWLIQTILKTKHEIVIKYDWYDPNTDISGNEIGKESTSSSNPTKTGYADVKYTTLGLGWNYYATANVKLTLYYDIVKNETTNSSYFMADGKNNGSKSIAKDIKDNVLTIRVQYKF